MGRRAVARHSRWEASLKMLLGTSMITSRMWVTIECIVDTKFCQLFIILEWEAGWAHDFLCKVKKKSGNDIHDLNPMYQV
jgi:hypothetical protein